MGMLLTDSQRKWVSFLKEAARKKPPTKEIRPEVLATTVGLCSRQLHNINGRTIKRQLKKLCHDFLLLF